MRQIDDYFDDIPNSLLPTTLVENGTIARILATKKVENSDYNNLDVKNKLLLTYAYCCAYCEARVSKYDPIEHFRAKHAITDVNTEGYYWLGCHWSNLLMACSVCNSSFKKNFFPITGTRALVPVFSKAKPNAFFKSCHIRSKKLTNEEALLLHPVLDNPDEYLSFEENGTVSAKNDNPKGLTSIEIYGLSNWEKRQDLIEARKDIVKSIRRKVYSSVINYVNDERLYQDLLDIHVEIRRKINLKNDAKQLHPFSAIRRSCLVNFKSFFIDKFTGETEIKLNNAYQRLKQHLDSII